MKVNSKNLAAALLAAVTMLSATLDSRAQILVKVDTTKPWQGYMNVFNLPDYSGGYVFGSPWGIGELTAYFTGTSTLTLMPNTNTYNASDAFWVNPDGSGNKFMEANFYIENTALRGQTVTFSLTVLSNNLYNGTGGHLTRAFVKTLDSAAGYSLVPGAFEFVDLTNSATPYNVSITVNVPAGATYFPQYGFVTTGPNVNPAWVATNGLVRVAVDNSDPSITGQPTNQRAQIGGSASLTVTAVGGSPVSYQWKRYGTNLVNGGNISGATSATLNISNAQLADATAYTVVVTNTAGSLTSDPAILRVKTAAEFANALDNPGFEDPLLDPVTQIPTPWYNFAGAGIRSTNDFYAFNPSFPVQTIDGTNAGYAYNGGEYNGVFQDVAAAAGQIFTADANFYVSSQEQLFGDITAWLEVQFLGAGGLINIWKSESITVSSPMDVWIPLPATNGFANDFVTPIGTARYLVAPPGTARIRYQVTVHAVAGPSGAINFDGMQLMKKIPVNVTSLAAGGNVTLSWLSQGATSYQVVYKDNLNDSSWTPVGGTVAGDGTTKSVSFPASLSQRFYSVLTL
jgi:hypothetical protein